MKVKWKEHNCIRMEINVKNNNRNDRTKFAEEAIKKDKENV